MSVITGGRRFYQASDKVINLVSLYINSLVQKSKAEDKIILLPNSYVFTRALEVLFYMEFSSQSGVYVSVGVGAVDKNDFKLSIDGYQGRAHSWLVYKENPSLILDIVPVYGLPKITRPTPVLLQPDNCFGYIPAQGIDTAMCSQEQSQATAREVDTLADVLQDFLVEDMVIPTSND